MSSLIWLTLYVFICCKRRYRVWVDRVHVALPVVRDQSVSALPRAYSTEAEADGHVVDNRGKCDRSTSGQARSMNVGRALLTGVQWEQPPWQLSLWGSSKRQVNNMLVLNASYRFKSRSCRITSTDATRWNISRELVVP